MTFLVSSSRSVRRPWRSMALWAACAAITSLLAAPAHAADDGDADFNANTLQRLMQAKPSEPIIHLSPVREAELRTAAQTLGTQTGLIEKAKEIKRAVEARRVEMERTFRFGDLVIGAGVLPPVVLDTENAVSIKSDTMRIAGAIYQIKQPARFFSGAPSWRDWLLMGLPVTSKMPPIPSNAQLLPRDANERTFWEQEVKRAYLSGRQQGQQIFDHNLAMLEEVYTGMRVFYDLYQRGMVSAPVIAKSQEILTHHDPNTIVVGDTLFRITIPAKFNDRTDQWKALAARPSFEPPLAANPGYDMGQVKEAYAIYKQELAARAAGKTLPPKPGPTTGPAMQMGVIPNRAGQISMQPLAPNGQGVSNGPIPPVYARPTYGSFEPKSVPPAPVDLSGTKPLFSQP